MDKDGEKTYTSIVKKMMIETMKEELPHVLEPVLTPRLDKAFKDLSQAIEPAVKKGINGQLVAVHETVKILDERQQASDERVNKYIEDDVKWKTEDRETLAQFIEDTKEWRKSQEEWRETAQPVVNWSMNWRTVGKMGKNIGIGVGTVAAGMAAILYIGNKIINFFVK